MYCKECGTENDNKARFCKNCGMTLKPEHEIREVLEKEKAVNSPKKKKNKLKIIFAIILILVAIIVGVLLAIQTQEDKKVDKLKQDYQNYVSQAEKYMEDLDYENAEDFYLRAIEIDPKQEEPYLKLVDVYLAQEEYDKAIEILEQAENNLEETDSSLSKKRIEIEERGEYRWMVDPTIVADDINYVTDTGYYSKSLNGTNLQYESPYAVIQIGDAMGLIDMSGKIKGEARYEKIECFFGDTYMLKSIEPVAEDELPPGYSRDTTWDLYLLEYESDEIVLAQGLGGGIPGNYAFYWCNGLHHIDEEYSWAGDIKNPISAIPVQQSGQLYSEYLGDALSWWMNLPGKYAVCKNKELVTDFIYDKCGSSSEGILAVCQDGKWGYIDENGEVIIPIEYDSSWNKSIDQNGGINEKKETDEFCYAANDGFIPLVKDGKWELRDTTGKLIILPGVFEAIRPVYEGKCWVKKEGKWGVIQLETESTAKEMSEDDEKIAEEVTQGIYESIYSPILQEIDNQYNDGYWSNYYCFYDIDKDGVKELIAQKGTCEADAMFDIYTIIKDNGKFVAKYLGEISGFHCSFYEDENGGKEKYIIRSEGHMGYGRVSYISIESGQIVEQEISSGEMETYYFNNYPISCCEIPDLSLFRQM